MNVELILFCLVVLIMLVMGISLAAIFLKAAIYVWTRKDGD